MSKWKRFLAVGCSHGHLADKSAMDTVLEFKEKYKPDTTMHLGDFLDMTALRAGAKGNSDETKDINEDFSSGIEFLEKLEPDIVFTGNHEDRLWRLADSPNAVLKYTTTEVIKRIEKLCKSLRAELVPYDIHKGWRKFGNFKFGHGYMFSEAAIRDHAELVGNCVIAHLHRVGIERGRIHGGATGYCVGCLADITKMTYAKTHRAKAKWCHGFAWGEYSETTTIVNLCQRPDSGEWRLPNA